MMMEPRRGRWSDFAPARAARPCNGRGHGSAGASMHSTLRQAPRELDRASRAGLAHVSLSHRERNDPRLSAARQDRRVLDAPCTGMGRCAQSRTEARQSAGAGGANVKQRAILDATLRCEARRRWSRHLQLIAEENERIVRDFLAATPISTCCGNVGARSPRDQGRRTENPAPYHTHDTSASSRRAGAQEGRYAVRLAGLGLLASRAHAEAPSGQGEVTTPHPADDVAASSSAHRRGRGESVHISLLLTDAQCQRAAPRCPQGGIEVELIGDANSMRPASST